LEKILILVYGGLTQNNGKACGLNTKKRCDKLLQIVALNKDKQFSILLAAGNDPKHPWRPPLKQVMKIYLEPKLEGLYSTGEIDYVPSIILVPYDAWNTANESLAAAQWMLEKGYRECCVVSSLFHMLRIELVWYLIDRIAIHPVTVKDEVVSIPYEMAALVKLLVKDRPMIRRNMRQNKIFDRPVQPDAVIPI
jgi:hypothetical protein